MGLTSQLPNIHHYLISFFRQFMLQPPPTDVQGLFISYHYELDTSAWHHSVLHDSASSCKLERIEFCKTKTRKLHEFLILYFSHHTHTSARAAVVVDRAPKNPSQSSAIASPSFSRATPARDRVYVVGQNDSLDACLSSEYGEYHKLCILEYPHSNLNSSMPQPPSAIQLSNLLLVVTGHQPDYNLYEHNCYWFADMVFEASKKLFPGYRERCDVDRHNSRGRYLFNLPTIAKHNLPNICGEYSARWGKSSETVVHRGESARGVTDWQVSLFLDCSYW
jgi:hypothetical protein